MVLSVFVVCKKNFAALAIQNAPSEDSDQTAQICKQIWNLCLAHMFNGTFSDIPAHLYTSLYRWGWAIWLYMICVVYGMYPRHRDVVCAIHSLWLVYKARNIISQLCIGNTWIKTNILYSLQVFMWDTSDKDLHYLPLLQQRAKNGLHLCISNIHIIGTDRTKRCLWWRLRSACVSMQFAQGFPCALTLQSGYCRMYQQNVLWICVFTNTCTRRHFSKQKVLLSFLFLHGNIHYRYSLEVPRRGASNEYHKVYFGGEIRWVFIWIPLLCRAMIWHILAYIFCMA